MELSASRQCKETKRLYPKLAATYILLLIYVKKIFLINKLAVDAIHKVLCASSIVMKVSSYIVNFLQLL